MSDVPLRKYPTVCPACQQAQAVPVVVTTHKDDRYRLIIKMCCHACDHRWEDVIETLD